MAVDPLEPLRATFRRRCEVDRRAIIELVSSGADSGIADLRRVVHGLSGLAGSFGFGDISQLARSAEEVLERGTGLPVDILDKLCARLAEVSRDPQ